MIYTTISPIAKNFFDGYNLCWSVLSLFNESWKSRELSTYTFEVMTQAG